MIKVTILVGIPCSGKSTLAAKIAKLSPSTTTIISRDDIRLLLYGKNYKHNHNSEKEVTDTFNRLFNQVIKDRTISHVILDNTHCKESYINPWVNWATLPVNLNKVELKVRFLDISYTKACYRNIVRFMLTGKWIPWNIMKAIYNSYNKINKSKYAAYLDSGH